MKFCGYVESEYCSRGFVMPLFAEDSSIYFQRLENSTVSYILLNLEEDSFSMIRILASEEIKKYNLDYNNIIIAFVDEDGIVYAGSKKYFASIYKYLKLKDKFKISFERLIRET